MAESLATVKSGGREFETHESTHKYLYVCLCIVDGGVSVDTVSLCKLFVAWGMSRTNLSAWPWQKVLHSDGSPWGWERSLHDASHERLHQGGGNGPPLLHLI